MRVFRCGGDAVVSSKASGSCAEQRDKLRWVEHVAGVAIAEEYLAGLPEVGHRRGHDCAAIILIDDLGAWEVDGDIAPACDDRMEPIPQCVGCRLQTLRWQHLRKDLHRAHDNAIEPIVDRSMEC